MAPFEITIEVAGRQYKLTAGPTNLLSDKEIWEVKSKRHTFRMECNRPQLEKRNLYDVKWSWALLSGECPRSFLLEIQKQIQLTVEWMNKL